MFSKLISAILIALFVTVGIVWITFKLLVFVTLFVYFIKFAAMLALIVGIYVIYASRDEIFKLPFGFWLIMLGIVAILLS